MEARTFINATQTHAATVYLSWSRQGGGRHGDARGYFMLFLEALTDFGLYDVVYITYSIYLVDYV